MEEIIGNTTEEKLTNDNSGSSVQIIYDNAEMQKYHFAVVKVELIWIFLVFLINQQSNISFNSKL